MADYKKFLETVYDVIDKYINPIADYTGKAEKVYSEILKELLYKGFPSEEISELCKIEDVSRIFCEVDEMAEAGYQIDKQAVALFKFYKSLCNKVSGKEVNLTDLSSTEINKLLNCSKALSKVGGVTLVINTLSVTVKSIKLVNEGKGDEAGAELRKFGFGLLGGVAGGIVADALIASLVVTNPLAAVGILTACALIGSGVGEGFSDFLDAIFNLYDDAGAYTYPVDPLIFDLDGDGIETVSVKNGVNFDFDNNGFAEKIGWVGADDGLLVRDLNGNGNIDNGGELFGDLTAVEDGVTAVNGFEALKAFDANGDGVIDANDEIYAELKIWQDRNQNGVADDGELLSLQEAGIAAIGLDYNTMKQTDEQGNVHTQQGYYVKTDGSTALVEDVWFDKDAADTVIVDNQENITLLEETDEIRRLPDIQGSGNQYSLHQAMLRDETGTLQALVEQYVKEESMLARKAMLTQIIYVWTGVADKNSSGRGDNLSDARKLEALEVITGREFSSRYGSNPVEKAADYIEQAFDKLIDLYFIQMEQQANCAELYGIVFQNFDIDDNGNLCFGANGMINMINYQELYDTVSALGDEYAHAVAYIGDDTIYGSDEDDILIGETGNDKLYGGKGNDTYIFNLGDGQDVITEGGGTDTIVFGEGIRKEDIRVSRKNHDLYLTSLESGDQIMVRNFFYGNDYFVEKVEF